jgi:redox-sensing transcriptional repressor
MATRPREAASHPGGEPPEESGRISDSTVRRLSGYYRVLEELTGDGKETISSYQLAGLGGATPAQVRKDLSCFGSFGKRGTGYNVRTLRDEIRGILGLNRRWRVALVGAGNLGSALSQYKEFRKQGFEIVAIFDKSRKKIGTVWGDLEISSVESLEEVCRKKGVEIGVIAAPASASQEIAERMVRAGVKGILNFAPRKLFVPDQVVLRNVNMAIELESLSFALK